MSLISLFIEKLRYLSASIKCLKRGKAYYCVYIQLNRTCMYIIFMNLLRIKTAYGQTVKMCLIKRVREKKGKNCKLGM